jgi:ketosteroid isomerase-like protein
MFPEPWKEKAMSVSPDTIQQLETRFWQALVDKDIDAATSLIADDSLVANPAGVMRIDPAKYGEMTRDGEWTLSGFDFKDVQVVFPTKDVAVIGYTAHQTGDLKGEKMDLRCVDTSTWVQRDGAWKCAAHTETILGHMPMTN